MTLATLRALPTVPPGIYRYVSRARAAPILATITDFGWYAGYIDGRLVDDKQTFLLAAGRALAFPAYYGNNWDAFEEMVHDLSWLGLETTQHAGIPAGTQVYKGCAILYDHAHRFAAQEPEAWQTALDILRGAISRWQEVGVPFYVLLRHNRHWNRQVPRLAAQVTERRL